MYKNTNYNANISKITIKLVILSRIIFFLQNMVWNKSTINEQSKISEEQVGVIDRFYW